MRNNSVRWIVAVGLGLVTACDESGGRADEANDDDAAADQDGGKTDALGGGVAATPGQLRWDQMAGPSSGVSGVPLFVSNNPEHVESTGILAGVPYPGLSLSGAQRKSGAPLAEWSREVIDPSCPDGGMREFGVYLAHILPAALGTGRRLTLVVVPAQDTVVRVRGQMGTTDWSSNGASLTTSPNWLGATLAKAFFFGSEPERTFDGTAGKMLVIDSEQAKSLVEGRYHVRADACMYPFTIAHAANLGVLMPTHYAKGDVKWVGWSNGLGFGRAAGVYEGDVRQGEQTVSITEATSVQGVGLLTSGDAMKALARHGDSAEILFGNYGVLYQHTLQLSNDTGECVDTKVELVSYMDRNATSNRTPTEKFFRDTTGAYTPSMFWNGPVKTVTSAAERQTQAILNYAPTAAERNDPTRAMGSMRHQLADLRMTADARETVEVRFPVPGYIVAPMALTVHAEPCE